jgi:hypothetical protein
VTHPRYNCGDPVTLTARDLEELRSKYVEMRRLRVADASGEAGDPRADMAELARRFPGALREIDELPLEVIEARIEALGAALGDPSRVEAWMAPLAMFHAMTRGALAVKRWLAGRKVVDDECAQAFAVEAPSLPHGDDAMQWCGDLARLASPPRGRVTDLVFERIAQRLGVGEAEARVMAFGVPRRHRR